MEGLGIGFCLSLCPPRNGFIYSFQPGVDDESLVTVHVYLIAAKEVQFQLFSVSSAILILGYE